MRQYLTGADLFAYIQMMRQVDARLTVIVEGVEDCGLIDPHLDHTAAQTIPGHGKQSVIDAAALFDDQQVDKVRLIIDADFDRQLGMTDTLPANLILTEYHDLDADVFFNCNRLVPAIIANFCDRTKHRDHIETVAVEAEALIIDIAAAVGIVRYSSLRDSLQLKMHRFPMTQLIQTYELNRTHLEEAVAQAVARSGPQAGRPDISVLTQELAVIADRRTLCGGHDIMSIFSTLIRERWGGRVGSDVVANAFRTATSCDCWRRTRIYADVNEWSRQHGSGVWTCDEE